MHGNEPRSRDWRKNEGCEEKTRERDRERAREKGPLLYSLRQDEGKSPPKRAASNYATWKET